jgi:RND family efflux transporter MFP subunit
MNRFVWIGLFILGFLSLGCLTAWRVGQAVTRRSDAAEATAVSTAIPVELYTATSQELVETVRVAGSLRALHEVDIVADVPGRVVTLSVDVGSTVRKGETLARLESTDLSLGVNQAEAALAMAAAGQTTAARDLEAANAVSAAGGMADAQLVAAKARAASGDAQVQQARAALGMARARLADATLATPIDGVVTRRATDIGRMVSPGVPAFTVQDLSALELVVSVDERTAARLTHGATVAITSDHVPALPDGTIKSVQPALDAQSRKAEVVIGVAPAPGLLARGTASATLELGRATRVTVPARAVREDTVGYYVWTVEGDTAKRTPVTPMLRTDDLVQVDGLPEGANVVIAGQNFLTDGATVTSKKAEPS